MLILLVWGPYSENHWANIINFPSRDTKIYNQRARNFFFIRSEQKYHD